MNWGSSLVIIIGRLGRGVGMVVEAVVIALEAARANRLRGSSSGKTGPGRSPLVVNDGWLRPKLVSPRQTKKKSRWKTIRSRRWTYYGKNQS